MIVRERPNAWQLLFILRGSVIQQIFPQIIFIGLWGFIVVELYRLFPAYFPVDATASFTVLGVSLSVFMGFRNNTCYDRWWTARQLWGQLITDSRAMARELLAYIDAEKPGGRQAQERIIKLCIAFAHGLRYALRDYDCWEDARRFITPEDISAIQKSKNECEAILRIMGRELGQCRKQGLSTDIMTTILDRRLDSMTKVLTSCEGIRNTPVPLAYTLLLHRTAYLYCFLLPFGFASPLGWAAPVISMLVAYAFFGLDALGQELEDPFGERPNNLALSAMSRAIEINLLEALGEETPDSLMPEKYYLP
jgi:putative membrane protein